MVVRGGGVIQREVQGYDGVRSACSWMWRVGGRNLRAVGIGIANDRQLWW